MPPKKPAPQESDETATPDLDEAVERALGAVLDTKLNAAITAHFKRFEKSVDEKLTKLAPPKVEDKAEDKPPADGAKVVDPETRKLREQLETLTKKHAESDARAKAAELKTARDATHADLRGQLEVLGIKGPKARAVIADLEQSGMLRRNEESGQYELAVKRARAKGAKAEELVFDDLGAGLKDWAGTDDAKEFLPASAGVQAARRPGAGAPAPRRPATQADAPTFRSLNDDIRDFKTDLESLGSLSDLSDDD